MTGCDVLNYQMWMLFWLSPVQKNRFNCLAIWEAFIFVSGGRWNYSVLMGRRYLAWWLFFSYFIGISISIRKQRI